MDHIEEAKRELNTAIETGSDDMVYLSVEAAKAHALISIAESLATLAGAISADNGCLMVDTGDTNA